MHVFFELLSAHLNAEGLTVQVVLKPDTTWNAESIKELIWRPVQQAVTGKKSTTKLNTKEVSDVYEAISSAFAHKGFIVPSFPSYEENT